MDTTRPDGAIVWALAFLFSILALINMVYFHYRYQRAIDQQLCKKNGHEYIDYGLLLGAMWLAGYGAYCLFPSLARRDGHEEFFASLPKNQRYHLIFIFVALSIGVTLMLVGYVMTEYLGLSS